MGIKKCGCGLGSGQDEMLQCGCGGNTGSGVWWPENQKLVGGHQKFNQRSPLLANNTVNQKLVKCGCDLDYDMGHYSKGGSGSKSRLDALYRKTKADYIGLNRFK